MKVFVVDDDYLNREGWVRIKEIHDFDLEILDPLTLPGIADKVRASGADVVVMDLRIHMNDEAGVSAIRDIRSDGVDVAILALTDHPHLIHKAHRAGADHAMAKNARIDELVDTLRGLASRRRAGTVATERSLELESVLTPSERRVLALKDEGLSRSEIARRLGRSPNTVDVHLSSIKAKRRSTRPRPTEDRGDS